jgi:hypothetical protein
MAIKVSTASMSRDRGSENIFADLALPNSKQETIRHLKAEILCSIA